MGAINLENTLRFRVVLIVLLLLTLLTPIVFANSETISKWDGFITLKLDKEVYDANEKINGVISINNLEEYPLFGGTIIFNIVEINNNETNKNFIENIISQEKIEGVWALKKSSKEFEFYIDTPGEGNYKINSYFQLLKTKISGDTGLLFNPISKTFSVNGNKSNRVQIIKNKTYLTEFDPRFLPEIEVLKGVYAQEELITEPNAIVNGKVSIKNNTSEFKENLILLIRFCKDNSSFSCEKESKIFEDITLNPNEEKELSFSINAPNVSSSYEINYELKESDKIQSIYKNRIFVTGEGASLQKIIIPSIENKTFDLNAIFLINDVNTSKQIFELKTSFFNSDVQINEFYETLEFDLNNYFISKNFSVNEVFNKVCFLIFANGFNIEEKCLEIKLEEAKEYYEELNPKLVNVSWEYNESNKELTLKLNKELINAKVTIIQKENIVEEKTIENVNGEYLFKTSLEKKDCLIIIDDYDAKQQQVVELVLDEFSDLRELVSASEDKNTEKNNYVCLGKVCEDGFVCNNTTYNSISGVCCTGNCVVEKVSSEIEEVFPLIIFVALILLVITIFVIKKTMFEVKK